MVDASPVDEMTPEQLRDHNDRLREEVDREREERNFFQLERDKVNAFWEISKKQLDEAKATIRVKERELEDAEERHQVEIKVYKQKVKHLLYEHQSNVTELKQEGEWDIVLCVCACVRVCVYNHFFLLVYANEELCVCFRHHPHKSKAYHFMAILELRVSQCVGGRYVCNVC